MKGLIKGLRKSILYYYTYKWSERNNNREYNYTE